MRIPAAATRKAREIVVDLIQWEMNAADGEGMIEACEEFGPDVIKEALRRIINNLQRADPAP